MIGLFKYYTLPWHSKKNTTRHMNKLFLLLVTTILLYSCSGSGQYSHNVTSTEGISDARIIYMNSLPESETTSSVLATRDTFLDQTLQEGEMIVQKVPSGLYSIHVIDKSGTTIFNDLPSKYINMNATLEVTRNVFQVYFPVEWAPMKGSPYTSVYLRSNADRQVFYMKTVYTGTDKEIGVYSEDF